jgi:hypothetical protein
MVQGQRHGSERKGFNVSYTKRLQQLPALLSATIAHVSFTELAIYLCVCETNRQDIPSSPKMHTNLTRDRSQDNRGQLQFQGGRA